MPRRLYIYRRGTTDDCAVTAEKKGEHLPSPTATDHWRFWMQIGPAQAQNDTLGFNVRTAVRAILMDGYHLFTGSKALLGANRHSPGRCRSKEGQSNA